VAIQGVVAPVP